MSDRVEASKLFSPVNSIEYAVGSVVSRSILKKPAGNITLFAFDRGEGLAEHSTPHDALIQLLDGRAEISIGSTAYDVQSGQCIVLPANVPHALRAPERCKMMLIMIRE